MEKDIDDECTENQGAPVFCTGQQEPDRRLFLVCAVRISKPFENGVCFVQHNPQRLRRNQSVPNSKPAR